MIPKSVRLLLELDDAMNKADLEIFEAEKAGNTSARIVALRERSQIWTRYAELLTAAGAEAHGARLSAQRDLTTARQLADGA